MVFYFLFLRFYYIIYERSSESAILHGNTTRIILHLNSISLKEGNATIPVLWYWILKGLQTIPIDCSTVDQNTKYLHHISYHFKTWTTIWSIAIPSSVNSLYLSVSFKPILVYFIIVLHMLALSSVLIFHCQLFKSLNCW